MTPFPTNAIGGVFGVMNTMFAAIGQRTRDIGVLRLLGFTRLQVLASFLLESIVISLIGGALGCAIGFAETLARGATPIAALVLWAITLGAAVTVARRVGIVAAGLRARG